MNGVELTNSSSLPPSYATEALNSIRYSPAYISLDTTIEHAYSTKK